MGKAHDFPPLSVDTFIKRQISYNPFHLILQLMNANFDFEVNNATNDAILCTFLEDHGRGCHLIF